MHIYISATGKERKKENKEMDDPKKRKERKYGIFKEKEEGRVNL